MTVYLTLSIQVQYGCRFSVPHIAFRIQHKVTCLQKCMVQPRYVILQRSHVMGISEIDLDPHGQNSHGVRSRDRGGMNKEASLFGTLG